MAGILTLLLLLSGSIFLDARHVYENATLRRSEKFDLLDYNSYDKILEYITALSHANKKRVIVSKIGRTYERRDLVLVKVSNNFTAKNPVILVDCGAHAREWAAVAAGLALLQDVVWDVNGLLDGVDWYIIPNVNPDGYEYSRNTDRLWRKNRSRHPKDKCFGTDLNRNFDFHWAESGVSRDPCDTETFAGFYAFSELETRAVKSVMFRYSHSIKLYLSLHAFGRYMVHPFGYTKDILPPDWEKMHKFAKTVTDAATRINQNYTYNVMSAGQWYPAAGGSDDYAYGVVGIPYSFTLEITNDYAFEYPAQKLPELYREMSAIFETARALIYEEFKKIK